MNDEILTQPPDVDIDRPIFDWENPTVQFMGKFQPWHDGHTAVFERCHAMTGQVAIMVQMVPKKREANSRVPGQADNPFDITEVFTGINLALEKKGFTEMEDYVIMAVPNIVDVAYGREVGYTFTEHKMSPETNAISSSQIRAKMRADGLLSE